MRKYIGFSTQNWLDSGSLSIADIETVKTDLKNHIFTKLGERLMQPGFGTRIPDLTFEQNDQETIRIIREDLNLVFNFDPRVEVVSLNIIPLPDNNTIIAKAVLRYIEFDVVDELRLDIKSGSN